MTEFILEVPINPALEKTHYFFIKNPGIVIYYNEPEFEFMVWGDPIWENDFHEKLKSDQSAELIVNSLSGHYYYMLHNKSSYQLIVGNSQFSILPLYYYKGENRIVLSENALTLGKYLGKSSINKRFILETVLFNYPLFNSSVITDIRLLPSNSYMRIADQNVKIVRHTEITDYFLSDPIPWRKSTIEMSEIFITRVQKYLPEESYLHALTGGFDGRTLLALGLFYQKNFKTFCFGSEESRDIQVASKLAEGASLEFINISLNDQYVTEASLTEGQEFIINSSGTATFARAHYLYAAKALAEKSRFVVTGNFGSEIFRAAHIVGPVISSNLFNLFDSDNLEEGFRKVINSHECRSLNIERYSEELEELRVDLKSLQCYSETLEGLTKNQRFYLFVFEELFRKYFGAEMINQFRYIKNRTPFLDMDFLKAILKTGLAGIHSGFFEHNPLKRYKGQVLYAHIIRQCYPEFGKMMTDKGYRPDDLLSLLGKLRVAKGYLEKTIRKPIPDFDPYRVQRSWTQNKVYWTSLPVLAEYFNVASLNEIRREDLFKVLSLSYLLNTYKT